MRLINSFQNLVGLWSGFQNVSVTCLSSDFRGGTRGSGLHRCARPRGPGAVAPRSPGAVSPWPPRHSVPLAPQTQCPPGLPAQCPLGPAAGLELLPPRGNAAPGAGREGSARGGSARRAKLCNTLRAQTRTSPAFSFTRSRSAGQPSPAMPPVLGPSGAPSTARRGPGGRGASPAPKALPSPEGHSHPFPRHRHLPPRRALSLTSPLTS